MSVDVFIGLAGALIGATAVFLLEFWAQVLRGRAAARLIKLEMVENGMKCKVALAVSGARAAPAPSGLVLSDSTWRDLRLHVLPFLPENIFRIVAGRYSSLFTLQGSLDALAQPAVDIEPLKEWVSRSAKLLDRDAQWMQEIESGNRAIQFCRLLLNRPRLTAPTHAKFQLIPSESEAQVALFDEEGNPVSWKEVMAGLDAHGVTAGKGESNSLRGAVIAFETQQARP